MPNGPSKPDRPRGTGPKHCRPSRNGYAPDNGPTAQRSPVYDERRGESPIDSGDGPSRGFSLSLIRSALIRQSSNENVYLPARKSMTIQFHVHSIAKRAESIALLDSGATENFMNLAYAKWLRLPIKALPEPKPLLNVDGTENKSGKLRYYTDLDVRTGTSTTTMRFFLSDLGEHKAILGYPWFAAAQPRIDWKRGWIDHAQLPIVLRAPNARRAIFVPRTRNVPRQT